MKNSSKLLGGTAIIFLTACQPAPTAEASAPQPAVQAPPEVSLYSNLDRPTTPEDMQGATTLTTDRYRPSYTLAACEASPLEPTTPPVELKAAIDQAKAYSDAHGGFGLIVMYDGKLLHESYGEGVDASTLTASASMAKSAMALLFGIAVEQGLIHSIDDRVENYLEEWRGDSRGAITLRQMLTMSSGLGSSDFMRILLSPNIAEAALETPLEAEPGSVFTYNNAVSKLLAVVLDRRVRAAGHDSLQTYLRSQLWCPLGNGEAELWVDQTKAMRGYAGLHAALRDWVRIGELIRNRGQHGDVQVVSHDWIEEMATPSAVNSQYGLHVWLAGEWTERRRYSAGSPVTIFHSEPFVADDLIYFDGFGGQRVYIVPSRKLTIARVALVNMEFDDSRIPNLITRAID